MAIKLGDPVRQIVTPITGVVIKKQFIEKTDSFQFLVESPTDADGDGVPDTRWFEESQIEANPAGVAA